MNMDTTETNVEKLREAYRKNPDNTAIGLELAQSYCDLGWYNEAIDIYSSLVKLSDKDPVLQLEYGNTLFKKGDLRTAQTVFLNLSENFPERIEGWNNLGIVQLQLDDTAAAHASFSKVLELEPDNTGALLNLGNCFFNEGLYENARSCFERACRNHQDLPDGWYNLGNAFIELDRLQDARSSFEKALRYRRDFPSALKNLGWIHEHDGRLDDACRCYSEALLGSKTDARLHVNLGNVYVRLKRYDDAKKSYLTAIRLAPHELHGWMGLRSYALAKGDIATFVRSTMAVLGRLSDEMISQSIDILYDLHQTEKADLMLSQADRLGRKSDLLDLQRLLLYQRQHANLPDMERIMVHLTTLASPGEAICKGLAKYFLKERRYDDAIAWIGRIMEADAAALGISWRAMLAQDRVKETRKQILRYFTENIPSYDTYFLLADIEARKGNSRRAEILLVYALDHGFSNMEEIHTNPVLHQLFEAMAEKRHVEEVA
jgi:tetratricopeptide (TPR) repeat protein